MEPITVEMKPGDTLSGTYEITGKIAKGGWGVVYEARHLRLSERRVAVKVLRASVAKRSAAALRFRREAEICARLMHPNIVSVTDWDTTSDGSPFFVMEYLVGENLGARMARGVIPHKQVFQIVRQACSALGHAHNQGIIHRDLKPSNIFLVTTVREEEGTALVKILDFGISKIMSDHTLQLTDQKVIGTPGYMSPEQSRGRNEQINDRSDQFSLAAIVYEMLAGKPAFRADTVESLLYCVVHENPVPLGNVSPELPRRVVKAVERAMSKDPGKRYPSIATFFEDLIEGEGTKRKGRSAAGTHGSGNELPTLNIDHVRRPKSPMRATLLVAALLVVFTIVVAGMLVLSNGDKPVSRPDRGSAALPADGGGKPDPNQASAVARESRTTPHDSDGNTVGDLNQVERTVENSRPVVRRELGKQVLEKLDQAEDMFEKGQYREAIRFALQSIGIQDSPRGRFLLTVSYCALSDLGNAVASLYMLPEKERSTARKKCRELGLNL